MLVPGLRLNSRDPAKDTDQIMNRTLLASFGHPDDESFGMGGTLSLYARLGYRVELICATRGEAGEISEPSLATPASLGEVREQELRCAAETMGIRPPIFLGYRDSGMMGTQDNDNPQSFWRVDRMVAVRQVTRLIRDIRPDVVVTFEPGGGYGHPDHITIYQVTVAAIAAARDATRYPEQIAEGLQPHEVSKLYYTALPRRFFRAMADRLEAAGMNLSEMSGVRDGDLRQWGYPDDLVTTTVDVSSVSEQKSDAFWCHRTQLNPKGPFAMIQKLGGHVWRDAMKYEYFTRVQPSVKANEGPETDLFAGLT
jgi:LmbE family N-acetylglucosaminyl deacetylase